MNDPAILGTLLGTVYQLGMGAIGGVGLFFLRGIRDELKELRTKLESKVDKADCDGHRERCFPESLANHSHEGLPAGARVIGKAR